MDGVRGAAADGEEVGECVGAVGGEEADEEEERDGEKEEAGRAEEIGEGLYQGFAAVAEKEGAGDYDAYYYG